jgi:pilus assembly protein Flp/PilA
MLNQFMFWAKYGLLSLGVDEERGQGLVEYALILVLIAIVVIVVLTLLGGQINNVFQYITDRLGEQSPNN